MFVWKLSSFMSAVARENGPSWEFWRRVERKNAIEAFRHIVATLADRGIDCGITIVN